MLPVSTSGKQRTKCDSISASCDDPLTASSTPCGDPKLASINLDKKEEGKHYKHLTTITNVF
jgi:hypothetical protein